MVAGVKENKRQGKNMEDCASFGLCDVGMGLLAEMRAAGGSLRHSQWIDFSNILIVSTLLNSI